MSSSFGIYSFMEESGLLTENTADMKNKMTREKPCGSGEGREYTLGF
jgi:hypothetical protein